MNDWPETSESLILRLQGPVVSSPQFSFRAFRVMNILLDATGST